MLHHLRFVENRTLIRKILLVTMIDVLTTLSWILDKFEQNDSLCSVTGRSYNNSSTFYIIIFDKNKEINLFKAVFFNTFASVKNVKLYFNLERSEIFHLTDWINVFWGQVFLNIENSKFIKVIFYLLNLWLVKENIFNHDFLWTMLRKNGEWW